MSSTLYAAKAEPTLKPKRSSIRRTIITILLTLVVAVPASVFTALALQPDVNVDNYTLSDQLVIHEFNGTPCVTLEDSNHDTGVTLVFPATWGIAGDAVMSYYNGDPTLPGRFAMAHRGDAVQVFGQLLRTPDELQGTPPCVRPGAAAFRVTALRVIEAAAKP